MRKATPAEIAERLPNFGYFDHEGNVVGKKASPPVAKNRIIRKAQAPRGVNGFGVLLVVLAVSAGIVASSHAAVGAVGAYLGGSDTASLAQPHNPSEDLVRLQ
jgi:hypothetical protein